MEQTEIENLVETILGALFGLFGLSVFRFTVQKIRRPKEKLAAKTKPSIVSLMEESCLFLRKNLSLKLVNYQYQDIFQVVVTYQDSVVPCERSCSQNK